MLETLKMPRGPGILLLASELVPLERMGRISWGAAYLSGARMSEQIDSLRAAGAQDIYLWAHPNAWTVTNFEHSADSADRLCAAHGLAGYIADGETDMTAAQAASFGSRLAASARRGLSVGFTSFAGYARLADFADGCGGLVWGAVQIYNQSSNLARDFQRWLDRFEHLFGRSIIVVASFIPPHGHGAEIGTLDGFDAYLGRLPSSAGWCSFGSGPNWMQARLASWRPAMFYDSALWLLGIPTVAHLPILYAVIAVIVCAGAWFAWRYLIPMLRRAR